MDMMRTREMARVRSAALPAGCEKLDPPAGSVVGEEASVPYTPEYYSWRAP